MTTHRVLILAASMLTLAVTTAPAAQSKCSAAQYKAIGKKLSAAYPQVTPTA